MKRLLGIMIVTMMTVSQASTLQNGSVHYGSPTPIVTQAKTVIRSAPVLVKSPRIPKFKILRSNPHRFSKIIDDVEVEVDDEGLITSYRKRDLNKIQHEEGISDKVRWRLFLARQAALLVHRSKFG